MRSTALFFEMFLSETCWGIFVCECFHPCLNLKKKKTKLMKLYINGTEKLEKELDIVKIIKYLKNLRILVKDKFFKDKVELFKIEHDKKNVINLDESIPSSNEDNNAYNS
jgi:hypothetical protein